MSVKGLTGVMAIAAGGHHSLAVKDDGTVWSWGFNGLGSLGDGTTMDGTLPVQVKNVTNIAVVSAGTNHGLARRDDGTVWGWGENVFGEVGIAPGSPTTTLLPVCR